MPLETFSGIIDQAYLLGTEHITLSSNGETLLHPKIADFVSYCADRGFALTIFSNGSITPAVDKIIRLGKCKATFAINLSAINPEKFETVHGGNEITFYRTLKNIKKLCKFYDVIIKFIIMQETLCDLKDMVQLAGLLGVKHIVCRNMLVDSTLGEKRKTFSRKLKNFLPVLKNANALAKKTGIQIDIDNLLLAYLQKAKKLKIRKCYSGWFNSMIDFDGPICSCCSGRTKIGNINNSSFMDAYLSSKHLKFLLVGKQGIDYHRRSWKKCQLCHFPTLNLNTDAMISHNMFYG